ncbi:esterase-like activity of phytase-domain-containing protein [Penicillium sp. IBT 16267x]|nr:esterase-like activity of phytase-domain-containing protein [Penicillium sp. IBT 16267x]
MDQDHQIASPHHFHHLVSSLLFFSVISATWAAPAEPSQNPDRAVANEPVFETTCSGQRYSYYGLAAYGSVPSNATDRYGDTLGGFGSAVSFDQSSWSKAQDGSYNGVIWAMPDRGWNTNGTLNYQSRIHKFSIHLDNITLNASGSDPSPPNMHLTYLDSILLTGPDGVPITSLDADATGFISHDGFPPLPRATYDGDGFGAPGLTTSRIALDCEGLAVDPGGDFWVSDEYGPYIYRFSKQGKMLFAIQPPPAFLPLRNGTFSFSAGEPPMFDPNRVPRPLDPTTGRANNEGLEGLTISSDGNFLYAMMQSALNQEGGQKKKHRRHTRLLEYDISTNLSPRLVHEYVVTLPLYDTGKGSESALQSEILRLSNEQLLILARDSGFGRGADKSQSKYRHVDVISTVGAQSIAHSKYDSVNGSIASAKGKLDPDIRPATYCPFLDYNLDSELRKFGLHNGGHQDTFLLNEKWESLALVPLDQEDPNESPEYLLFSFSDNDFKTQEGYQNFGRFRFSDGSGNNIDTQVLAFRMSYGRSSAVSHKIEL